MKTNEILNRMANKFRDKIEKDFRLKIRFNFTDIQSTYFLIVQNGEVMINNSLAEEVDVILTTTEKVLKNIYRGEITAFTAAGKAHITDDAPLNWEIVGGSSPEEIKKIYYVVMHFFNTSKPEKIKLGEQYSRKVHGGHAIPLYYHPGFRSAWYMVKKDEQINEPGDVNPFPQAIVVINGKGYAKIGDQTVEINSNESYYIPPKSDHVIWTESEESLVLIWLAWGEGA